MTLSECVLGPSNHANSVADAVASGFGILALILLIVRFTCLKSVAAKGTPISGVYNPPLSWTVGFITFSVLILISYAVGVLNEFFYQMLYARNTGSDNNSYFVFYTILITVSAFVFLWIIWANHTLTFDRQLYLLICIFFGFFDGFSNGLFVASFYWLSCGIIGVSANQIWVYLLSFVLIGGISPLYQSLWRDLYITPAHDNDASIRFKTFFVHIPNSLIFLLYLVLYQNVFYFVLLNPTFGLVGGTIAMRMVPWFKDTNYTISASYYVNQCGCPCVTGTPTAARDAKDEQSNGLRDLMVSVKNSENTVQDGDNAGIVVV